MSSELLKYLRDMRFWIPLLVLLGFEGFLQSGLYKYALRPESYAENVNRNVGFVAGSDLKPNVLILGTSVAYQGINMPLLTEELEGSGLRVMSAASQGALLITQHSIYRYLDEHIPSVKLIVHVSETTFPWTARHLLDESNRSMLAQFPRTQVLPLLDDYDFHLKQGDYSFLLLRSITYRKDLRDFALDPASRFKRLGRKYDREGAYDSPWGHANSYDYSIAAYNASNLKECIENARAKTDFNDENGNPITDADHKQALFVTCEIGLRDPINRPGAEQWNRLFFKRLRLFHDEVRADGRVMLTVFPPYSNLIPDLNKDDRLETWDAGLAAIYGDEPFHMADLRRSLDGPDNNALYYDTIHLNRAGSARFTKAFAEMLKARAPELLTEAAPDTDD